MSFQLSAPRGGRRQAEELVMEIVRELGPEDQQELERPSSQGSSAPSIQSLRASHHQLAQLLAQGRSHAECGLISGYSVGRVGVLAIDPAFADLVATYTAQRQLVFADTLQRMQVLGLSSLDELQERLETDPSGWSNRELMEMAELMLVKPSRAGATSAPAGAGGVTVNVKFVSAPSGPTIEGTAEGASPNDC